MISVISIVSRAGVASPPERHPMAPRRRRTLRRSSWGDMKLHICRHDVGGCRYEQLLAVHVRAERLSQVFDKGGTLLRSQAVNRLRHRQGGQMAGDELLRQRQLRHLDRRTHSHVAKADCGYEVVQLDGVMESGGRSRHGASL